MGTIIYSKERGYTKDYYLPTVGKARNKQTNVQQRKENTTPIAEQDG